MTVKYKCTNCGIITKDIIIYSTDYISCYSCKNIVQKEYDEYIKENKNVEFGIIIGFIFLIVILVIMLIYNLIKYYNLI